MYHFICDCEDHVLTSHVCQVCAEHIGDINCEHEFKPDNLRFLENLSE